MGVRTLNLCEPYGLPVVLRGNGQCVEEDKQQHGPVTSIGLHRLPAARPKAPVGSAEMAAEGEGEPTAEIIHLSQTWGTQVRQPSGHGGLGGGSYKAMGSKNPNSPNPSFHDLVSRKEDERWASLRTKGQSVPGVGDGELGSRFEGKLRTGVRVWTGFWIGSGVEGCGLLQAACTTGQSPLLLFLIAWGFCHRTSVTGWETGCGEGGNRGQSVKTQGLHPWLSSLSIHPTPLPNLDGPSLWLLVECVERVE